MELVYFKLTELSLFPSDIIQTLKNFKQGPIFVKFHTIPPEKDEEIGTTYRGISLIKICYISETFNLTLKLQKSLIPSDLMNLG